MLRQKRKAQSPLEPRSHRRSRLSYNASSSREGDVEEDRPALSCHVRRVHPVSPDADNSRMLIGAVTQPAPMSHAHPVATVNSVSTTGLECVALPGELQYHRTQQDHEMLIAQGFMPMFPHLAGQGFDLPPTRDNAFFSQPSASMDDARLAPTVDLAFSHQTVANSVQPQHTMSSSLTDAYSLSGGTFVVRNKPSTAPIFTTANPHHVSVSHNSAPTPQNAYAWGGSPLALASPTPSLTSTQLSSESAAARRMLWATASGVAHLESTPIHHSPWTMGSVRPDQHAASHQHLSAAHGMEDTTQPHEMHWNEHTMPTLVSPSDHYLLIDPEPGPGIDLNLAAGFQIHPPVVMPGWRSPQMRPSFSHKRASEILPNLSSHIPYGGVHTAPWGNDAIWSGHSTAEMDREYDMYPQLAVAGLPKSTGDQAPGLVIGHANQSTSKELPIRFTQETYDTMKEFCAPPPSEKESPFVNDPSHYTHCSFKPRQYNPRRHYTIPETTDNQT